MNIQVIKFSENPNTSKVTTLLDDDSVKIFTPIEQLGFIEYESYDYIGMKRSCKAEKYNVFQMISYDGSFTAKGYYTESGELENIDHVELNDKYRRTWRA